MDLHVIPFENVYNLGDPNVALSHWIDLFLDVINKHAPLKRRKRKEKRKKEKKRVIIRSLQVVMVLVSNF